METARLVLEYLKAKLSPQDVAGIVALAFCLMFKEDIKALMRRIAKIRFPGGSEVSTTQVERASEESSVREAASPVPPPEQVPLPSKSSAHSLACLKEYRKVITL